MAEVTNHQFYEDCVQIWEWGKHARSEWFRTKYPPWLRILKLPNREPDGLKRIIPEISPERFDQIEKAVTELPSQTMKDVLVDLYVNNYGVRQTARDLGVSDQVVWTHRNGALQILYGRLCYGT